MRIFSETLKKLLIVSLCPVLTAAVPLDAEFANEKLSAELVYNNEIFDLPKENSGFNMGTQIELADEEESLNLPNDQMLNTDYKFRYVVLENRILQFDQGVPFLYDDILYLPAKAFTSQFGYEYEDIDSGKLRLGFEDLYMIAEPNKVRVEFYNGKGVAFLNLQYAPIELDNVLYISYLDFTKLPYIIEGLPLIPRNITDYEKGSRFVFSLNTPQYYSQEDLYKIKGYVTSHLMENYLPDLPNSHWTTCDRSTWVNYYNTFGINDFELEIIAIVNRIRTEHGLNELSIHPKLAMAARYHAQSMIEFKFYSHTGPHYPTPFDRVRLFTKDLTLVSENVFGSEASIFDGKIIRYRNSTAEEIVEGWMNSPSHQAHILREGITYIGTGHINAVPIGPVVMVTATNIKVSVNQQDSSIVTDVPSSLLDAAER